MSTPAIAAPTPHQRFLTLKQQAEALGRDVAACGAAQTVLAELRAEIERCDDEAALRRLLKTLPEAELDAKVAEIRSKRLAAAEADAWVECGRCTGAAVDHVIERLAQATGTAFDDFTAAMESMLDPGIQAEMLDSFEVASRVQDAIQTLASVQPGVARANRTIAALEARRGVGGNPKELVFYTDEAVTVALGEIPEIQRESAKTSERAAAIVGKK